MDNRLRMKLLQRDEETLSHYQIPYPGRGYYQYFHKTSLVMPVFKEKTKRNSVMRGIKNADFATQETCHRNWLNFQSLNLTTLFSGVFAAFRETVTTLSSEILFRNHYSGITNPASRILESL